MKIKTVSCTQFAGIRNQSVSFQDGLNLFYGKNESGKSTLVNLLSRTLFQSAKLDARTDKDFIARYFPSPKKDSPLSGDFADGTVTILKDGKEYTVSKEWSRQPVCRLTAPEGIFKEEETVDSVLKNVLGYGEGVFADFIFSSQRNTDISLESVLDAKNDTQAKKELIAAVTQAFSQSDGIRIDEVEQAIQEKISEIAGKHWDRDRNQPQRKAGRWVNGVGGILKAYYALEDAKLLTEELKNLETQYDSAFSGYSQAVSLLQKAEEQFNRLNSYAASAAVFSERKRRLAILETQLKKCRTAAKKWPVLVSEYEKACALQREQENRTTADKYQKAGQINDELKQYQAVLASSPNIGQSDINEAKAIARKSEQLKNRLCAMNISTKIKMLGENSIDITAIGTGEKIPAGDEISLNQAVEISIPGVMQMQLSPADIDTDEIRRQLADCHERTQTIFQKYSVNSVEELEEKAVYLSSVRMKEKSSQSALDILLREESFEELEKRAAAFTGTVRQQNEIEKDIAALTGGSDIMRFIAVAQAEMKSLEAEYRNQETLGKRIDEISRETEKIASQLAGTTDIPKEYLEIEDIDEYCNNEKEKLTLLRKNSEQAFRNKAEAVQRLEAFKENYGEDIQDRLSTASTEFENQKELLACWEHILEVFYECKNTINDNPTEDLAESFLHYLTQLTDEKVTSAFPEKNKIEISVFSSDSLLSFHQLSEGTKQTVSLAFRLAVLDRLFPDGGVIVFDDPFSDMDSERKKKACKLVESCAMQHQVIFLTCHREYEKLFGIKAETVG